MKDRITLAWIVEQSGMSEEEIRSLPARALPKPDAEGTYPARAIQSLFRLMRERLSRQDEMSTSEIAELLEVTPARITHLKDEGVLAEKGYGRFHRAQSIRGIVKWLKGRIGESGETLASSRRESATLQNEILKMNLQKARRESYDRKDVEEAWSGEYLMLREQTMRMPSKLAQRLGFARDPVEIQEILEKEMEAWLTDLSQPISYEARNPTEPQ